MIYLKITKDIIRTACHVRVEWDTPMDGIHPSRSNTLNTALPDEDAAETWINGIAAALEATHLCDVRYAYNARTAGIGRQLDHAPSRRRQATLLALERFTAGEYEAWIRMNSKTCDVCGMPMRPCPKGPGADEPGYCGFYNCPCKRKERP